MSVVGKITTLDSSSAPITQTLFGRCTTAADVKIKEVNIVNNSFNMLPFEEGFNLRVFFENGNIIGDPELKIRIGNSFVSVEVISFAMYQGQDHEQESIAYDFTTCACMSGGIISFTYVSGAGGKFIIDNQALDNNDFYGYQNSNTYFVDWAYGAYNGSTLQTCGYQNPNIKNGHYIYGMILSGDQPVREPSTTGAIEGVLRVTHTTVFTIEEWTFRTEPGNIYRRIWANNAWSTWSKISGIALS